MKELLRAGKFAAVGVLNTLVDLGLFTLFAQVLGWDRYLSNLLSYGAGMLNSYIWNRSWTFRSRAGFFSPALVKFLTVNLSMLALSTAILYLGAGVLGLPQLLVKLGSTGVTMVCGFLLNRLWVFSDGEAAAPVVSAASALLPAGAGRVWRLVTGVEDYGWRSDLSRAEVLEEGRFVEYTRRGFPTLFTVTAAEPCRRWEFDLENESLTGHWTGVFTPQGEETRVEFTEEVTVKKAWMRPLAGLYLKKQQARFLADLRKALEGRGD